jgi:hypothetical protein
MASPGGSISKAPVHRIVIVPTADADGKPRYSQRGPLYTAWFDGEVIVAASVQPLFDACRVLKARGLQGPVEMWDRLLPYARLRCSIDQGAKLTVWEGEARPQFATWKQPSFAGGHAKDGQSADQGNTTPSIDETAAGGVTTGVSVAEEIIA